MLSLSRLHTDKLYSQFVDHGYKVMHAGQLITVFSARNYLDVQSNDSALLLIALDSDEKMRIRLGSLSLASIPSYPQFAVVLSCTLVY